MSSSKNHYAKRYKKNTLLGAITQTQDTKGDIKGSLIETGKDILMVVSGGAVGVAIGRASFISGLGVTTVGHYMKNRWITSLGLGMMAAPIIPTSTSVNGVPTSGLEGAKERLLAFKDDMSKKLFLDKFQKGSSDDVAGTMGDVQYFNYSEDSSDLSASELDMRALDELEYQINNSASNYQTKQIKGFDTSFRNENTDFSTDGFGDLDSDINY
jgi:hypothetical protein